MEKIPQSFNKLGMNLMETFYRNKGILPKSYSFSIVSENKVLKYLNTLGINKATGFEGISSRLARDGLLL